MQEYIDIKNAKVHNLKNVSLKIPKNKFVVITGVSGSGKSSLAFDTLYAEGQRRYVESLSSYARQFLGLMEKPDVESITGLSPAISIDQKTSSSNPRSTVGTITEIYDYLRLLYGHIGETFCPNCGRKIEAQTIQQIVDNIKVDLKEDDKIQIISPIVQNQKGTFKDLLENLLSKGFLRVAIDGKQYTLDEVQKLKIEKNIKHNIDLIIDRLVYKADDQEFTRRLTDAVELSSTMAEGEVKVLVHDKETFYSENNTCFNCKISFPKIKPSTFSFNAPYGACLKCSGLGTLKEVDITKIYNPKLTIKEGGIFPWANRTTTESWTLKSLEEVAKIHGFNLSTPIGNYPQEIFDLIFYGKGKKEKYTIDYTNRYGYKRMYDAKYEGVIPQLERLHKETTSDYIREEIEKFMIERDCSDCGGKRLQPYALSVKIDDKNIDDIATMSISNSLKFFKTLKLDGNRKEIAQPIIKEIISRLQFLEDVGLTYLTLSRKSNTLSGGESQRIRLASQIGTGLTGVLYVLDEPSIGLHSKDVHSLIKSLIHLRDLGNSVVVVEHDYDTISEADWIVDVGPEAGSNGGQIIAEGKLEDIRHSDSLTARYINKELNVGDSLSKSSLIGTDGDEIEISGVTTHNLRDVNVKIPLSKFVVVTGVSGSGKSSLINDTFYPILMNSKMGSNMPEGKYQSIKGLEHVHKVIGIDQSPIGRTPRSNPATYTNIFTYIREIYASTPESRARGYTQSRFSFNVKGGRCEKCKGDGQIKIEMQFLPDMYVTCEECGGNRYNKDALQIDYKGKNIAQVLDMTVDEGLEFFNSFTPIRRKLEIMSEVGLGYIKLGQPATTLSGGESQRIKLSKELSKMTRGHTVYILDEPTTGLHFHDVDKLLILLKKLVEKGNSVIVIEHNMDIIKFADWIIDLGPEGGEKGGKIIGQGTVQDIINNKKSYTGIYLKKYIES
ncbi:MAG TPA: excinuclease ABC subunit UvrA [Candidatus Dojkabacteria bacterium]|nr:excinuclease ABC subunit UvrA [Candidatus Dojkabacteria bacterium]